MPSGRRFGWLGRSLQSAWTAYGLILLFQLKIVWWAWNLLDLTTGDTSAYYASAIAWYRHGRASIVWSPLYLVYYGSLMHAAPDAYDVTILHRMLIVFAATAGVLAVLRRMLPHALALLVAAWWAVLPINFDALYEVHLFALLPVLMLWLAALRRPKTDAAAQWARASVLAGLLATMFLVRNEMFVAVGCFASICLAYEVRHRKVRQDRPASALPGPRKVPHAASLADCVIPPAAGSAPAEDNGAVAPSPSATPSSQPATAPAYIDPRRRNRECGNDDPPPWLPALGRYIFCGLMTLLLVVFFYERSTEKLPVLTEALSIKHRLNMAQVYAAGYQQRHPERDNSPWTDYQELCQRDFGTPLPSLTQMLRRNPRATLEHFAWNFRLVPAGLQVLLFDRTSIGKPDSSIIAASPDEIYADSSANPDYAPVIYDPRVATPLTFAAVAIVAGGLLLVFVNWRYWWEYWLRDRAWGWAAMLAVAATAFLIIPTQRPRPSYLFSLSVLLMTITGMCVFVILRSVARAVGLRRPSERLNLATSGFAVAALVAFIAIVQPYYLARADTHPRPLLATYKALLPYEPDIRRKNVVLLKGDYAGEVMNYLGWQVPRVLDYSEFGSLKSDETLPQFLDRRGINMLFLDDRRWTQLEAEHPASVQDLIEHGPADGWRLIGFADTARPAPLPPPYLSRWLLFKKAPTAGTKGTFDPVPEGLAAAHGGAFRGWREASGLNPIEGPYPNMQARYVCWGIGPSTRLTIPAPGDGAGHYNLVVSGLSGLPDQVVTITLDGQRIGQYPWGKPGVFHDLTVPLDLPAGTHQLEMTYTVWQNPTVKMAVLFKKLQIVPE